MSVGCHSTTGLSRFATRRANHHACHWALKSGQIAAPLTKTCLMTRLGWPTTDENPGQYANLTRFQSLEEIYS